MANFNIPVKTPDAKDAQLVAALRWNYGTKDDGSDYTLLELLGLLSTGVRSGLKDVYVRHQRYLRDQTAIDEDFDPTE